MFFAGRRKSVAAFVLVLVSLMVITTGCNKNEEAVFDRPITLVVPFSPGGATDLIGRALEANMEKKLGVDISVQNMPGGATSVGNQYVMDAEHDGYTVLVQPTDITSIGVMEQSKLTYRDWEFMGVAAAVPATFVVPVDSPYNNLKDLAAAMKEKQLTCGVAASGCAWTRAIGLFAKDTNTKLPELVPMGGGGPAAISAMKKEVDLAACGLPECIEFVKGGKLKTLDYWGPEDIEVEGYGTVTSIAKEFPEFGKYLPYGGWVGLAVPKGTPEKAVNALTEAFKFAIEADDFKKFLADNYFVPVGLTGDEAVEYIATSESVNAWLLYDLGFATKNPEELNIPR